MRETLKDEQFRPPVGLPLEEARARTTGQLQDVLASGFPYGAFTEGQGGTGKLVTR